jgi:hypothetical protein
MQGKFTWRNHGELLDRLFGYLPQLIDRIIEWGLKSDPYNAVTLVRNGPDLARALLLTGAKLATGFFAFFLCPHFLVF